MTLDQIHSAPEARWHSDFVEATAGRPALAAYAGRWSPTYRHAVRAERAVDDAARLEKLVDDRPVGVLAAEVGADGARRRFSVYVAGGPLILADLLPMMQSLGMQVLDEQPFQVVRPDGKACWIYDFGVNLTGSPVMDDRAAFRLREAFAAIVEGSTPADRFNGLILSASLTWQEAAALRAYAHYLHQAGFPLGRPYAAGVLAEHPAIAGSLVGLFHLRFDPDRPRAAGDDAVREAELVDRIEAQIDQVAGLNPDRVLRAYLALIRATVRTNYYLPPATGPARALALKFDPRELAEVPAPRPRFEVFVSSTRVEGVHIRFGPVARGGLRWSDRPEDFRTEILGLAKAQVAKNAVIVPAGAKGGFVVQRPPTMSGDPAADRAALLAEGVECYRTFISALLDVADTRDPVTRRVRHRDGVLARDGDDPYLVVAADKGTATFSDIANAISLDRGFWLGDAFASGGSVGYDHKAMGITAKGAWESVRRHFRELGVDVQRDAFTVVGIGDMSGDVFGNGLLRSTSAALVAAFDHRHIFLDPTPDPARSHEERQRLYDLPRSSWADYDPTLISPGGGVYPRTAKSVPVSPEVRAVLGLAPEVGRLNPNELIRAILAAPIDLLWNGGIGTYVKASGEAQADAGDRTNDGVRVNGADLRARVVGEGGNLGFTQRGRIEYARSGGRINTDALDNSAGVGCSDLEVNIKIVVDTLVNAGEVAAADRPALLASMTGDVADLVLAENINQNELLGVSRTAAADRLDVHARLIEHLERTRGMDRDLLALPDAATVRALRQRGAGLSSPELATLTAQVKLAVKADLLDSDLPDDASVEPLLLDYFPAAMRGSHATAIRQHPLRREIVTTVLTNQIVDFGGISYPHRLAEDTAASTADAGRAFLVAAAVFDLPLIWRRIRAEAGSTAVSDALHLESIRVLDRASRWLLRNRPQPLSVSAEVDRLAPVVAGLGPVLDGWLQPDDRANRAARQHAVLAAGGPADLVADVFGLLDRFCLLDVAEVSAATDRPADQVATTYFLVKDHYHVNRLLQDVSGLDDTDQWNALARQGLREDLYAAVRRLCQTVVAASEPGRPPAEAMLAWEAANEARLGRARRALAAIDAVTPHTLAILSVAVRQIQHMAGQSGRADRRTVG